MIYHDFIMLAFSVQTTENITGIIVLTNHYSLLTTHYSVLTVHAFWRERLEEVWARLVHDGHTLPVLGRHPVLVGPEGAVLEGAHRVQPRLAGAVDKAAVDPARLRIDLGGGV